MTVVVLGIDALDPDLVDAESHPNLTLDEHKQIETMVSSAGEPSTHELWPTIITGLPPEEHGLKLEDGIAWENPLLSSASRASDYILPDEVRTKLGAWLLNTTSEDAFRVPASYYDGVSSTVFDGSESLAIGIPNYVIDPDSEDREHQLRRDMGTLFKRNSDAKGGHTTSNLREFYERCLEMAMIRIARVRRGVRGRRYDLVFGYTSGLDLIGHISHSRPEVQSKAYDELNDFVGELRTDLRDDDVLILVSDHGLQDGRHTEEAMIASTEPPLLSSVESVLDIRSTIESAITEGSRESDSEWDQHTDDVNAEAVREQLEDLGYM